MDRQIEVRRGLGVWIVDTGAGRFAFASGSEAERWARRRAQSAADAGETIELKVFDLRDELVGSVMFESRLALA